MKFLEVFDGLPVFFKESLKMQWDVSVHDTPEDILGRHGEQPLKVLRTMMILAANHHLAGDGTAVGAPLWDPQRPEVGRRLKEAATALPAIS